MNATDIRHNFAKGLAQLTMYLDHSLRCNCRFEATIEKQMECVGNYTVFDFKPTNKGCNMCLGAIETYKQAKEIDPSTTCEQAMDTLCKPYKNSLNSVGVACRLSTRSLCNTFMLDTLIGVQTTSEFCYGQQFCQ